MSDSLLFPVTGTCISASAGTGKTYALTSRFLSLLALGAPPESLIALTFTNKAAGEFRNRILSAVAEGALSEATPNPAALRVTATLCALNYNPRTGEMEPQNGVVPLAPAVAQSCAGVTAWADCIQCVEKALEHRLDAAFFMELLNRVVRALSRMRLSTLDSFFQKIVASHCTEFGISEIQPLTGDDLQNARQEALLYMLSLMDDPECRASFLTLYQDVLGEKKKGMLEILSKKVQSFSAVYRRFGNEDAWADTSVFVGEDLAAVTPVAEEEIQRKRQEYNELLPKAIADIRMKRNSKAGSTPHAQQALESFLKKMEEGDFSPNSRMKDEYLGKDEYSSSPHPKLKQLVQELEALYRRKTKLHIYRKTMGMYKLMKIYTQRYQEAVQSTGRFTFDDMTAAAGNILEDFGCDAASELDARLEHWMLDEFQDTAPAQWKSLASPLLLEAADSAPEDYLGKQLAKRSLFVVGDMKQSIYGFREARPELFAQLSGDPAYDGRNPEAERCKRALHTTDLNCSYRSAPVLMGGTEADANQGVGTGFINTLFRALHEGEKAEKKNNAVSLENYCRHSTADTPTIQRMKGYVRIAKMQAEEKEEEEATGSEDNDTLMLQSVENVLRELQDSANKKCLKNGITVAVLVRSNEAAQNIVQHLQRKLAELPVQLISDSFVALDSSVGEVFMSFFLWLAHPADSYRKNILIISGLLTPNDSHEKWMSLLAEKGYAAVIGSLVKRMGVKPEQTVKEWTRAALAFDEKGGCLSAWIRRIRNLSIKGVGSPLCVQVMTMHKSKGLEFDAVILPYNGSKPVDDTKDLSYFESEDGKHIMLSPGGEKKRSIFGTGLDSHIERWKKQQRQEAYNLMYVALTRAKYANYILLHPKAQSQSDKGKKTWNESGMILRALPEAEKRIASGKAWTIGTENWYDDAELIAEKQKKADKCSKVTAPKQELGTAVARRPKLTPSHQEEEATAAPEKAEKVSRPRGSGKKDREKAEFGTEVHALFEQIEWWHSGEPLPFEETGSKAQAVVKAALQVPEIADLFRQRDGMVVYNEQPFEQIVTENGQELWASGIIDRLVLERTLTKAENEQGEEIELEEVTAAHIIDYKTSTRKGKTAEEQDNALREQYRVQMSVYHTLICAAFNLPANKVSVSLISCPDEHAPARIITY